MNPLHLRSSKKLPCLLALVALLSVQRGGAAAANPELQVAPCARVSLTASYLAELKPGAGPTYHFRLTNETEHPIVLARPSPAARTGSPGMASTGIGEPLPGVADPWSTPWFPTGRCLFTGRPSHSHPAMILKVAPHSTTEWEEGAKDNPALEFKPSCSICNHPEDREFRAIFAYAYLPLPEDKALGLLPCGIRSSPVDVPPIR